MPRQNPESIGEYLEEVGFLFLQNKNLFSIFWGRHWGWGRTKRKLGIKMGVHFLLCRTLCGNRKCLEISQAGLRKWRGFLPHSVLRHPAPDWEADVLFGACTRTVCSERSHQDLAYVASGYWSWYWSMRCFNHRYKESVKFSFKTIIFYF